MIKKRSVILSVISGIILLVILFQYFKENEPEINDAETEKEWVKKVESDIELQDQYLLMNLYTADIDTYETKLFMRVVIPKSSTLEEQFRLLMLKLGEYHFNIPIEDIEFSTRDNKVIATVNLKEHPRNQNIEAVTQFKDENWAGSYFQGSAGSLVTTTALIETALQADFSGQWIDGVEFIYNGKTIEFDHMYGISEVKWRK